MRKYYVPFLMNYDDDVRQWEVIATSKKEAREIAFQELSSDQDVKHIGSTAHIVDMGAAKKLKGVMQ
jgi:hypothetical protein